jgi:putative Holliday junction resolvase
MADASTLMAFDFGTRRVGVAIGNRLLGQGQALRSLQQQGAARFDAIAALIAEWQPSALVVGVPRHPDGQAHDNTARAQRFARSANLAAGAKASGPPRC